MSENAILKECECGSLARIRVTRVTVEPQDIIEILFSSSQGWEYRA